jgi:hypothetical protein
MTLGFEEERENPVGDVALRLTVGWGLRGACDKPTFGRKERLIPGPKFLDGDKIIPQNCRDGPSCHVQLRPKEKGGKSNRRRMGKRKSGNWLLPAAVQARAGGREFHGKGKRHIPRRTVPCLRNAERKLMSRCPGKGPLLPPSTPTKMTVTRGRVWEETNFQAGAPSAQTLSTSAQTKWGYEREREKRKERGARDGIRVGGGRHPQAMRV